MAGQSRTLKLSILGDVDQLKKSLNTGATEVDGFADKLGGFAKKAGAAFLVAGAAAGAYAGKLAVDGVKAAIEDEKAQTQLALALENATGATNAQIAATEQSILKMSLATGVADDELRPALGRLVRSTGDITTAQDLLSTALDVATATGKPLETIANALGKAYDGNTAALGKLGIGLSSAELKTMSFEQVQTRLSDLFGGAAAANAETYAGKIARVQVAFDETKETIGAALLPILDKLLGFINENALPAINAFAGAFSLTEGDGLGKVISDVGKTLRDTFTPIIKGVKTVFDNVKDAIVENKDEFKAFFEVVKYIAPLIGTTIGKALEVVGKIAETVLSVISKVLGAIKPLLNTAIDGINLIIKGYNNVQFGKDIPLIPKIGATAGVAGFSGTMPSGQSFSTGSPVKISDLDLADQAILAASKAAAIAESKIIIAGAAKGLSATEALAAAAAASSSNIVTGSFNAGSARAGEAETSGATYNINVTGAFDKEGTARAIVETINDSFYRGTGGAGNFVDVA